MTCAVDVDVLHREILGILDCHGPHLGLDEIEAGEDGVGSADSEAHGTAGIVADAFDQVVLLCLSVCCR